MSAVVNEPCGAPLHLRAQAIAKVISLERRRRAEDRRVASEGGRYRARPRFYPTPRGWRSSCVRIGLPPRVVSLDVGLDLGTRRSFVGFRVVISREVANVDVHEIERCPFN